MACLGRGRGRGGRGLSRQRNQEYSPTTAPNSQRRGRISTLTAVQDAAGAYREGTDDDIRHIIQEMEANVMEEQSDSEIEEYAEVIRDPGNTRGRLRLYRKTLHIYWVLKCLLAKALEQVAREMVEISQGMLNLQKEMKNFQVIMMMQNNKLEEMQ